MIRFNFLIALIVGACIFTVGVWVFNSSGKEERIEPMGVWEEVLTNRTDEHGVSGKTILDDDKWRFTHCTSSALSMDCGRLE